MRRASICKVLREAPGTQQNGGNGNHPARMFLELSCSPSLALGLRQQAPHSTSVIHIIFHQPQGRGPNLPRRRQGVRQGTRRESVTQARMTRHPGTHPSCPWRPRDLAWGSGHPLLEPRTAGKFAGDTSRLPLATADGQAHRQTRWPVDRQASETRRRPGHPELWEMMWGRGQARPSLPHDRSCSGPTPRPLVLCLPAGPRASATPQQLPGLFPGSAPATPAGPQGPLQALLVPPLWESRGLQGGWG